MASSFFQRIRQLAKRPTISRKIAIGYVSALGLVAVGVGCGSWLGRQVGDRAAAETAYAVQKRQSLYELQSELLHLDVTYNNLLLVARQQMNMVEFETFQQAANMLQVRIANVRLIDQRLQVLVQEIEADPHLRVHRKLPQFYRRNIQVVHQYLEQLAIYAQKLLAAQDADLQTQQAIYRQALRYKQQQESEVLPPLLHQLNLIIERANQISQVAQGNAAQAGQITNQIVMMSLLGSLIVAGFLVILISRSISDPLCEMATTAEQIIERDNLDLRVSMITNDEVGTVAQALNQLLDNVASYTRELEDARNTLELRVQERTADLEVALQDLRQTQAQAIQAEKMSSLGQMVSGVAHEINNPTGFLAGNLKPAQGYIQDLLEIIDLYQVTYPEPEATVIETIDELDLAFIREDFPQLISSMQSGVDRIRHISNSLRVFSRTDRDHPTAFDVTEGLDSTLLILKHRLKETPTRPQITVVKEYGEQNTIDCYAGQLNQVFMNILANAIDAFDELYMAACVGERPAPLITMKTQVTGAQITVSIADNGPGIPDTIRHRIFEEFFTTKAVGKGTGIGMALSQQIVVERHHGQLLCDSTCGQGTTFQIVLPIHQAATAPTVETVETPSAVSDPAVLKSLG